MARHRRGDWHGPSTKAMRFSSGPRARIEKMTIDLEYARRRSQPRRGSFLDAVEHETTRALAASHPARPPQPEERRPVNPSSALKRARNDSSCPRDLLLGDEVGRGYVEDFAKHTRRLRRQAASLQPDAAERTRHVSWDEGPPVQGHRFTESVSSSGGGGRRGCGRLPADHWVERLAELRGDALLDRPDHVGHLVAKPIHLLDRGRLERGSERRGEQKPHSARVVAGESVHGPALPVAVASAVRRADERLVAEDVGDEEPLNACERADG